MASLSISVRSDVTRFDPTSGQKGWTRRFLSIWFVGPYTQAVPQSPFTPKTEGKMQIKFQLRSKQRHMAENCLRLEVPAEN